MDLPQVGATWLHLLATVVLLGYYTVLALIVLPILDRRGTLQATAEAVATIEARALPWIVGSLVAFLATGVFLMVTSDRYGGPGDFGSTWAAIFLTKHGLILGMVGVGLWLDMLAVRAPTSADPSAQLRRLRLAAIAITGLGALVLLLTAIGQAS